MSPIPLSYALEQAPRYTSFPTAAQFRPGLGETEVRRWLDGIGADEPLSLYVHVPYCRVLCWYCGCHTSVLNDDARIARYARRLEREADLLADALGRRGPVRHLHFGGGTPTILAPDDFLSVVQRLRERFPFAADAEVAVEIDPRTLTPAMTEALAAAGVNRVSLGVQDVSEEVQRLVNRLQPFETVRAAVERLRAAGVEGINVDLMYGLPKQTVRHVEASVAAVLALRPDRAAVFGYAHVPWFKKHQEAIDAALLPGAGERLDQARAAADAFAAAGWEAVGFDHYARPGDPLAEAARTGRLRRNFQGYTTDEADVLLGLGASSIGSLPEAYVQNEPHLGKWAALVDEDRLPVARGVALTPDDRMRRDLVNALMSRFVVDLERLAQDHGRDPAIFDDALERLAPLARDGLCRVEGRTVAVPAAARLFVRNVAMRFDPYLAEGGARHSRAV